MIAMDTVKSPAIWIAGVILGIATAPLAGQYTGKEGAQMEVKHTFIDRSQLERMLHEQRTPLLFHTDDTLAVQAYGIPELNFQQHVSEGGTITVPLLGTVEVAGLSVAQVEAKLDHLLALNQMIQDAHVSVVAISRPSAVVTVSGAVARPGVFPGSGNLTISDYISMAGGLNGTSGQSTGPAASSTVTLVRPTLPNPVSVPLGPDADRSPYSRIPVFPGDEIRVGKLGVVYTVGAFHTQGSFLLRDSSATTVLNLVSLAGGVGFQAKRNEAYIIRVNQGEKVVVRVPLDKIMTGKTNDMALQDQDILMVPTSQMRAAIKGGGTGMVVSIASAFIYSGTL